MVASSTVLKKNKAVCSVISSLLFGPRFPTLFRPPRWIWAPSLSRRFGIPYYIWFHNRFHAQVLPWLCVYLLPKLLQLLAKGTSMPSRVGMLVPYSFVVYSGVDDVIYLTWCMWPVMCCTCCLVCFILSLLVRWYKYSVWFWSTIDIVCRILHVGNIGEAFAKFLQIL